MSQSISRIGIDLAKTIFQVCAVNQHGKVLFNKKITRAKLALFIAQQAPTEIIMEACASAHYWSRVFSRMGHTVKLIHPAYVRPYVKTNKNDAADAEALCEAATRPQMRFVQAKTVEQQDIQTLHRVRERLVSQRTSLANQIRGLLGEYGIVIPQGPHHIRQALPVLIDEHHDQLTPIAKQAFSHLHEELVAFDAHVQTLKQQLEQLSLTLPRCQQWITVPGVGPMVATALYATMGDAQNYRNGREFAAFLGLVPRQVSSGGKTILRGISKRGDPHCRKLLVQGAHAALRHMHKHDDPLSRWACRLKASKGTSKAVVALANKLARICWALAAQQTHYQTTLSAHA